MGLSQLVGALIAVVTSGLAVQTEPAMPAHAVTHPAAATSCRSASARHVRASGLTCSVARSAIQTYEGSPASCRTSSRCVQSGLAGKRPIIVDCTRSHLVVGCLVYVSAPHGGVHNPKIAGLRVPGRYHRGTVRFWVGHAR